MYRENRFRIVATGTKNKLFNENIQHLLEFASLVRSVDNEAIILNIKLSLRSQLAAEKLGWIY